MEIVAFISFFVTIVSSLFILIDVIRYPQQMKIMNVVWPLTALYSGPLGIWVYYKLGHSIDGGGKMMYHNSQKQMFFWQNVLKATLHCGSGCTLGDALSDIILLFIPITIAGNALVGDWLVEYIAAFLFGIIFQYYAIKPMKQLSAGAALKAALKADVLSLTFWQLGMYGWMAISNFLIFHRQLKANEPVFWLMMQIGMLFGLATSYPINWWLLKKGIKESM